MTTPQPKVLTNESDALTLDTTVELNMPKGMEIQLYKNQVEAAPRRRFQYFLPINRYGTRCFLKEDLR